jgi:hypothetical protein
MPASLPVSLHAAMHFGDVVTGRGQPGLALQHVDLGVALIEEVGEPDHFTARLGQRVVADARRPHGRRG